MRAGGDIAGAASKLRGDQRDFLKVVCDRYQLGCFLKDFACNFNLSSLFMHFLIFYATFHEWVNLKHFITKTRC